jgi:hypothetical protein
VPRLALLALVLPAVALAAPVPKEVKDDASKLLVTTHGKNDAITLLNPDGSGEERLLVAAPRAGLLNARLSPDRTRMAYATTDRLRRAYVVWVRPLTDGVSTDLTPIDGRGHFFWSPDGKRVVCTDEDENARKPGAKFEANWRSWAVDAATGKRAELDVKGEYRPFGFTPAGGLLCVRTLDPVPVGETTGVTAPARETVTTGLKEFDPQVVIPGRLNLRPLAAFPDGRRWLVSPIGTGGLAVYTAGEKQAVAWAEPPTEWDRVAVSPDGKRVAYSVRPDPLARQRQVKAWKGPGDPPPEEGELWVADADGTNAKKVWEPHQPIGFIDWR